MLYGFSATIGTMVAMFTVFFGFVYAEMFMMVVGLTVTTAQAASRSRVRAPRPAIDTPALRASAHRRAKPRRA